MPESNHGVDAHGEASGDVASGESDYSEEQGDGSKGRWIARVDFKKQTRENS